MTPVSLVGLNSGLDTNSVIDRLLAGDRAKLTKVQWRQQAIQAQQGHLKDVAGKLTGLLGAVKALSADGAFTRTQQVTSGDPAHVAAVQLSGAGTGGHTLQVDRLASAAQRTYAWGAPDGLAAEATLTLAPAADPAKAVALTFAAGAKLSDVVSQINASQEAPVYAAAVDGRLVLSSRTSGSTSDFTVAGSLGLAEDAAAAKVGDRLDAIYRVDDDATPRTSHTNELDNAIPGLRLTLKGVTTAPVSITVSPPAIDRDAVSNQVKAVVTAYNALVDAVRSLTTEKSVAKPATASQAAKGTLFGDTGLNAMLSAAREVVLRATAASPAATTMSGIGITIPKPGASLEDAKSGHLQVDNDALGKALDADPGEIRSLFKALTAKLEPFVKSQTGGTGALIDARVSSGDRQAHDIDNQIARANDRIDSQQKAYSAKFAGMEKALGSYQSQQAWLTGMIDRLA
jgi:flagellar hook-associated protein 2